MSSPKIALRASEGERNAWERAAQDSGLKLSAWLRRAANEAADLQKALDAKTPATVLAVPPKVEEIRDKMYPQKRQRCVHRLNPNTFCKKCGVTK